MHSSEVITPMNDVEKRPHRGEKWKGACTDNRREEVGDRGIEPRTSFLSGKRSNR